MLWASFMWVRSIFFLVSSCRSAAGCGVDPFRVSSRHDAAHHLAGANVPGTNNTAPSSRPCANGVYELSDEHVFMMSMVL